MFGSRVVAGDYSLVLVTIIYYRLSILASNLIISSHHIMIPAYLYYRYQQKKKTRIGTDADGRPLIMSIANRNMLTNSVRSGFVDRVCFWIMTSSIIFRQHLHSMVLLQNQVMMLMNLYPVYFL